MQFDDMISMLSVKDIHKSLDFYQGALGFERLSPDEALADWKWALIRSGKVKLMLNQNKGPVHPEGEHDFNVAFYFYPDDVIALHEKLSKAGHPVTKLIVTFYGMKEFSLKDPDGHFLSFGKDTDEPPTESTETD